MSKYTWPDTDPPDKTDPHWEFNNNMATFGGQFKKEEVSPGRWQWVHDVEAEKAMAEAERRRRRLFWDLRSRVLTDEEMQEVERLGNFLNIENGVSYRQEDKDKELNEALLQQFRLRLRLIAERIGSSAEIR